MAAWGSSTPSGRPAIDIDPAAAALDELTRFPFCTRDELHREACAAGYQDVSVEALEIPTPFVDFAAFWYPFTLGAGPAPGCLASLPDGSQQALRQRLNGQPGDAQIDLTARAWAVRARPGGA